APNALGGTVAPFTVTGTRLVVAAWYHLRMRRRARDRGYRSWRRECPHRWPGGQRDGLYHNPDDVRGAHPAVCRVALFRILVGARPGVPTPGGDACACLRSIGSPGASVSVPSPQW